MHISFHDIQNQVIIYNSSTVTGNRVWLATHDILIYRSIRGAGGVNQVLWRDNENKPIKF